MRPPARQRRRRIRRRPASAPPAPRTALALTTIPWFDRSDHPFVPTCRQPGPCAQGRSMRACPLAGHRALARRAASLTAPSTGADSTRAEATKAKRKTRLLSRAAGSHRLQQRDPPTFRRPSALRGRDRDRLGRSAHKGDTGTPITVPAGIHRGSCRAARVARRPRDLRAGAPRPTSLLERGRASVPMIEAAWPGQPTLRRRPSPSVATSPAPSRRMLAGSGTWEGRNASPPGPLMPLRIGDRLPVERSS